MLKVDEIAERIRTLGSTAEYIYSQYAKISAIKESSNVVDGIQSVEILEAFKLIISMQREILELSTEANDEGTNSLMSDYIRVQEKQVWMYSAFLKK